MNHNKLCIELSVRCRHRDAHLLSVQLIFIIIHHIPQLHLIWADKSIYILTVQNGTVRFIIIQLYLKLYVPWKITVYRNAVACPVDRLRLFLGCL